MIYYKPTSKANKVCRISKQTKSIRYNALRFEHLNKLSAAKISMPN